jgi:hypothetical protein
MNRYIIVILTLTLTLTLTVENTGDESICKALAIIAERESVTELTNNPGGMAALCREVRVRVRVRIRFKVKVRDPYHLYDYPNCHPFRHS